jgi:predicted alpha-1,6-mannanase (GH76 family)
MAVGGKYRSRADAAMARLYGFYDAATGLWDTTGWWNSANALEATIDYSARTGDTTYTHAIANTFTQAQHRNAGFINEFFDDEGWWALAWIKAYDLTKDPRYLTMAESIFADMYSSLDDTCGGGIWWDKKNHEHKNAIPNELLLAVAARLHLRIPGDGGAGSRLEAAQRTWAWFDASGMINAESLVNDGLTKDCVNDDGVTWTYNQGVILGGLVALHHATGDDALLARARAIADAAVRTLAGTDGVLREPITGEPGVDDPQFKGIFVRNLVQLYQATNESAYRDFILANANSLWSRNRNDSFEFGDHWEGPFDRADATRQSSAQDALNSALLFDTPGTAYQAENGALQKLSTEATHAGFHGSGYVAGWNSDGQGVTLSVNVPAAGPYDVVLRYAAVGDATRCVRSNGTVLEPNHAFPSTGDWTRWTTTALYDVPLVAGANAIAVVFDASQGSHGWLNLDELAVE